MPSRLIAAPSEVTNQRRPSRAAQAPGWGLLGRVLVEALLTGLAAPFVLVCLRRVERLYTREEQGLLR